MDPARRAVAGKTLLIVEDDRLSAISLQLDLTEAGYRVLPLEVRHGEALIAARAGRPDLALVNIELEGGDDGVALANDLHAIGVPVLFISGQIDRAASARTVAVGSLPKPYSGDDIVSAVDYLLHHLQGLHPTPPPAHLEVFDRVDRP